MGVHGRVKVDVVAEEAAAGQLGNRRVGFGVGEVPDRLYRRRRVTAGFETKEASFETTM